MFGNKGFVFSGPLSKTFFYFTLSYLFSSGRQKRTSHVHLRMFEPGDRSHALQT